MSKTRVGLIGYGTIGKRVADAVCQQGNFELTGIGVRRLTPSVLSANWKRIPIYCTEESEVNTIETSGIKIVGDLEDLLTNSDVVIDCTQSKEGGKRLSRYLDAGVKVIYQGGEMHETTGFTFSTFANYNDLSTRDVVRVGSCNTTGLVRLLSSLEEVSPISYVDGSLTRCTTDPDKSTNGIVNGAAPVFGLSHHGPDVQLTMPHINIYTQAIAVPMFNGHIQMLSITFKNIVSREEIINHLRAKPRIIVGSKQHYGDTSPQLASIFENQGRLRGDRPELFIWEESIRVDGNKVHLITNIDMQSITIPETIDCLKTIVGMESNKETCIYHTDKSLGIQKQIDCYNLS